MTTNRKGLATFQKAIHSSDLMRLLLQRFAFDSAIMIAIDFPRDESLSNCFRHVLKSHMVS